MPFLIVLDYKNSIPFEKKPILDNFAILLLPGWIAQIEERNEL